MKNLQVILFAFLVFSILFMAGCSGGTKPVATSAPASAAAQDISQGQTLMQSRCASCHSLSKVTSQKKDQAGWESTVERMVTHGAQLNADERKLIVDYLVSAYSK